MRMKLATRVGVGYVALLLLLLLAILASAWALEVGDAEANRIEHEALPSLAAAHDLLMLLERMETTERAFFPPGRALAARVRQFDRAAEAFNLRYAAAVSFAQEPVEQRLYAEMGRHFGAYVHADRRIRDSLRRGQVAEAAALMQQDALIESGRLRQATQRFYNFNVDEVARAHRVGQDARFRAGTASVLAGVAAALVALYRWRVMVRDVVEPLLALQASARAAEDGVLRPTHHPRAERTLEIAALQDDLNNLGSRLAEVSGALSEANERQRSDFTAVTNHELLTPINQIVGYGSALEDGVMGPLTPEQHRAVAAIMVGADRLTRMVRNTLEFAQARAGTLHLRPESCDLAAILGDLAEVALEAAQARNQRLEVVVPPDLPDAHADPDRVRQIVSELLDNATKFSSEGARIQLTATAEPERLVVAVADTGVGMSDEVQAQIFRPFFQADSSMTRHHGGLGLGLALMHHLAKAMGGSLAVRSRLGQGSTFQLALPRADRPASATTAKVSQRFTST